MLISGRNHLLIHNQAHEKKIGLHKKRLIHDATLQFLLHDRNFSGQITFYTVVTQNVIKYREIVLQREYLFNYRSSAKCNSVMLCPKLSRTQFHPHRSLKFPANDYNYRDNRIRIFLQLFVTQYIAPIIICYTRHSVVIRSAFSLTFHSAYFFAYPVNSIVT